MRARSDFGVRPGSTAAGDEQQCIAAAMKTAPGMAQEPESKSDIIPISCKIKAGDPISSFEVDSVLDAESGDDKVKTAMVVAEKEEQKHMAG